MALSNGVPQNTQTLRDASLQVTVTLPNGSSVAATNNSNFIDLGYQTATNLANAAGAPNMSLFGPFPITRYALVNVQTTASTATANNKNCNLILQMAPANSLTNNSADLGNITNIPLRAIPFVRLQDSSNNTAATNTVDFLPPNCARFIRLQGTAEVNSGNFADATATLYITF